MARRSALGAHAFPLYVLICAIAVGAAGWLIARSAGNLHRTTVERSLAEQARIIRDQVEADFITGDTASVSALVREIGRDSSVRVTVILRSGAVIGESSEPAGRLQPHTAATRPEIAAALEGRTGRGVRFSETLRRRMLYVAVPVIVPARGGDTIAGVVRTSMPLGEFDRALAGMRLEITLACAGLVLLLGAIGWLVARRMAGSLAHLRAGMQAFSRGPLGAAAPAGDLETFETVADALAATAARLVTRMDAVAGQRDQLQSILDGMIEGVLALDRDGCITRLNPAGARMLNLDPARALGRPIEEALRSPALRESAAAALAGNGPVSSELVVHGDLERRLHVQAAALESKQGERAGAVLVFNDVSRLHRLERIRRDFVANVTHELRTPITSIRAAAETLAASECDAEETERFLAIIARQAQRLNAIIDDLLQLSRLESEAGAGQVALEEQPLDLVLAGASQTCAARAAQKRIAIDVRCDPRLTARIDAALLENAIVNLVDNAVKYSPEGTTVRLSAYEEGGAVVIAVSDQGPGIERRHHERIFERFYVVDKARSRGAGGTGLGLAIVRHIVRAHGGRVEVESAPGAGSTFRVILPRRESDEFLTER